jgi:hypothetical protein
MDRRTTAKPQRRWTPPDGLDRSLPREVRLTAAGRALVVASAALCIGAVAAGVGLAARAGRQAEELRLLQRNGASTAGEVTRLWRGEGESRRRRFMAYRFTVDGRAYERHVRLGLSAWSALRVGSEVPLRYLPSNPALHYRLGAEPRPESPLLAFAAGGALALCGGLVLLPLRAQRRLLAEGRAAQGFVTRHRRTQHVHHHGTVFHFAFEVLSGATVHGKAGPGTKTPAVGSAICVLYDPDDPRRNAPYPFALVEPAFKRSL